jgi:cytochrome P450
MHDTTRVQSKRDWRPEHTHRIRQSRTAPKWKQAAASNASINIIRDISLMVLEVTLRAIFGQDYDRIAPEFQVVAEESRDMEFAKKCSSLRNIIIQIAIQRRKHEIVAKDILGTIMQARDRERGQPMPDLQLAKEAMTLVMAT